MPASALEGRVSVGTGMEDKEAEVSLLVGFDTPPSPVSYDAILVSFADASSTCWAMRGADSASPAARARCY